MSLRLLIMAKAPVPGQAKTRLIPALGAEGAARLAHQLLDRTLAAALESRIGQIELCAAPGVKDPSWRNLLLSTKRPELAFSDQCEGDLGERMARASERALGAADTVMLIGTDCVEMSAALLRRAAEQLQSADAVIYPTQDGGYALLGLRSFSSTLFSDIPWSSDSVFRETRNRIEQLGWSLVIGEMLQDIDEPEDLIHLPVL